MPNITPQLVLGSGSPRRRELLAQAGYQFSVIPPHPEAECGLGSGAGPAELVQLLAYRKGHDVVEQLQQLHRPGEYLLLAADTVAECQGQILGKPHDEQHARQMLEWMRGQEHRVYTGICLWAISPQQTAPPQGEVVVTRLKMAPLSDEELEHYLQTGQWHGKAGAFGLQDQLGWVSIVEGSESNVVGLPMERVTTLLAGYGVHPCGVR